MAKLRGLCIALAMTLALTAASWPTPSQAQPVNELPVAAKVATTITGFGMSSAHVRVGGEIQATVKVSPGPGRTVSVQYRKKGASTWTSVGKGRAGASGSYLARLRPPKSGTWYFRISVEATAAARSAVSPARSVVASGSAVTSRVTRFDTRSITVYGGDEILNEVGITPGNRRLIAVQHRQKGASEFVTGYHLSTSDGFGEVRLDPPAPGVWEFRLYVYPSAAARSVTTAIRRITLREPRPLTIDRWTVPDSFAFGDWPDTPMRISGLIDEDDKVELHLEARPARGQGWGPWTTSAIEEVDQVSSGIPVILPGPGRWQIRVRTTASSRYLSAVSEIREVTMAAPVCQNSKTVTLRAETYTECDLLLRWGLWNAQAYVLQFQGSDLGSLDPGVVGVYFHGDGSDAHSPGSRMDSWMRARGDLLVRPVGPRYESIGPCWGCIRSFGSGAAGTSRIGADIRALGGAFDVERYAYWGHSGGSWFLSDFFIPNGIQLAPGPVALNCGAATPWPPEGEDALVGAWGWIPRLEPELRARVPLQFNYGDKDFLLDSIQNSHRRYTELGFVTERNVYPGVLHCGRDFSDDVVRWFGKYLPG